MEKIMGKGSLSKDKVDVEGLKFYRGDKSKLKFHEYSGKIRKELYDDNSVIPKKKLV